jgi:NADH:ubiquinone oxidoreductase subunit E
MKPHDVKVCCSGKCAGRGSERVFVTLEREGGDDMIIEKTTNCFGYCAMGPNVAVDGNILHHLNPGDAITRVRREITHPSPKIHGLGGKTLDDLDSILDDL